MQRNFGLKGRLAHRRANRTLHQNALRICTLQNNFRRVLITEPLEPQKLNFGVAYEA